MSFLLIISRFLSLVYQKKRQPENELSLCSEYFKKLFLFIVSASPDIIRIRETGERVSRRNVSLKLAELLHVLLWNQAGNILDPVILTDSAGNVIFIACHN